MLHLPHGWSHKTEMQKRFVSGLRILQVAGEASRSQQRTDGAKSSYQRLGKKEEKAINRLKLSTLRGKERLQVFSRL